MLRSLHFINKWQSKIYHSSRTITTTTDHSDHFSTTSITPSNTPTISRIKSTPFTSSHLSTKRTAWSAEVLRKIMPFSAELINSRGMLFDSIAVGYCNALPPFDINPITGIGKRRVEDSWLEIILPLSDHAGLRETMCRNDGKNLRYGKLFEILDSLAADVSYRHTGGLTTNEESSISIVTASVDGFNSFGFINVLYDLKLQGYIGYVGTSSMEINIDLISVNELGIDEIVGNTSFIMVARDNNTGKSSTIHSLILEDANKDVEEALKTRYELGRLRAMKRKMLAKESLQVKAPTEEEVYLVHSLYLKSISYQIERDAILRSIGVKSSNTTTTVNTTNTNNTTNNTKNLSTTNANTNTNNLINNTINSIKNIKWMKSTLLKNIQLMHTQDRNIHGKIFGGFLMKAAYELSWVAALRFVGNDFPVFLSADNISFIRPVAIGTIIEFTGRVTFTFQDKFVIEVVAEEVHQVTGDKVTTNQLIYIYQASTHPEMRDAKNVSASVTPTDAPFVVPTEYEEFIAYLRGKRAYDHYCELTNERH